MLSLVLAVMLSQSPAQPVVAVYERPAPGSISEKNLGEIHTAVQDAMSRGGVSVTLMPAAVKQRLEGTDAQSCVRGLDCLFRVGAAVKADVLISIEATELADDIAVSLEAVAPIEERRVARHSVVVKANAIGTMLSDELKPFADEVARALPSPDAPLADATQTPPIPAPPLSGPGPTASGQGDAPAVPPEAIAAQTSQARGGSRVPAWIAAGGATVAAATATGLAISGFNLAGQVNAPRSDGSEVRARTFQDAQATADRANGQLTVAAISTGVAAALTTVAILLWQD